jgi:hypothetical protein
MLPWSLGSGKEVVEGCLILGPEPDLGKLAVSDPGDDYLQALVRATPALHPLDHQVQQPFLPLRAFDDDEGDPTELVALMDREPGWLV